MSIYSKYFKHILLGRLLTILAVVAMFVALPPPQVLASYSSDAPVGRTEIDKTQFPGKRAGDHNDKAPASKTYRVAQRACIQKCVGQTRVCHPRCGRGGRACHQRCKARLNSCKSTCRSAGFRRPGARPTQSKATAIPKIAKQARDIGIVVLPGKGGNQRWTRPLVNSLSRTGFKAMASANLPWTRGRIFDRTVDGALKEVGALLGKMRNRRGVKRVVLAGHSLGAVVSAAYGARHGDIAGIILLAPGHFVGSNGFSMRLGGQVTRARKLIAAGKGKIRTKFQDLNMGKTFTRIVTPEIYASWFSPDGPASFQINMAKIKPSIPVLYVAAGLDRIPRTKDRTYVFDGLAKNPKHSFVTIERARHLQLPALSVATVVKWLNGL